MDINGLPANGGKIFTYAAGSTTKKTTFTDSTGLVANSNPIILNARGEPSPGIWLSEGSSYKLVFTSSTDSDPPASPIVIYDNISGVGDNNISIDQWVSSNLTPTYISATSFTVPGDQTSNFQVGRRVKATITAGTVYGYILTSVFTTLTTVTLTMDTGQVLDSGLSAVQLGLLTPINPSIPYITGKQLADTFIDDFPIATIVTTDYLPFEDVSDSNKKKRGLVTDLTAFNTAKLQTINATVASNALTATLNPTTLDFRSATLSSGTINTRIISSQISLTVASGANLGTAANQVSRLALLAIDNAGTVELAIVNITGLTSLRESSLISTTALSGSSNTSGVIYSTTARSNVPFRFVGYILIVEAAAGTWATAPTEIQGAGGKEIIISNLQESQVVSTSSGQTSYPFTGIPAWAKRITIMFNSVSFNGTSNIVVQLGTVAGFEGSGYLGSVTTLSNTAAISAATISAGFQLSATTTAAQVKHGTLTLTLLDPGTNSWTATGIFGHSDSSTVSMVGGSKSLSGVLDRITLIANGVDVGDLGAMNVMWD